MLMFMATRSGSSVVIAQLELLMPEFLPLAELKNVYYFVNKTKAAILFMQSESNLSIGCNKISTKLNNESLGQVISVIAPVVFNANSVGPGQTPNLVAVYVGLCRLPSPHLQRNA